MPAVSSGHDVAHSEYEPEYAGQTDLARVETLEPAAENEAEFEEAISSLHDAELQEAAELPEPEFHEAEFQETTTEYEPEENASASYRVDPAGAREFRQSGGVEELEAEHKAESGAVREAGHVAEPEFTSLQATGEMISEVAHAEIVHADPTAPIEHEAVVQSVHAAEAETPVSIEGEKAHALESAGGFAPGVGQLEEELLDEEDAEIGGLQAGAFDDDIEEETLEGAADLGSMIRDMTIDDITRPEPVEVDEDDEEDDED
jgi:ribonuclease G